MLANWSPLDDRTVDIQMPSDTIDAMPARKMIPKHNSELLLKQVRTWVLFAGNLEGKQCPRTLYSERWHILRDEVKVVCTITCLTPAEFLRDVECVVE